MRLALKDYQRESLDALTQYARGVRSRLLAGVERPDRAAFEEVTGDRPYFSAPGFANTPYVCIRIPTGGGKTLLAAHAVGAIGRALLETDQPACLWITPSTTIRDQTLRALANPHHPYRLALDEALGTSVQVATLEQALLSPQLVRPTAPLVIVTTIQSYRIADEEGRELAAARRIYRDNGYMQEALANLPDWAKAELAVDAKGNVDLSLANALRRRRPIVVMDEAHNARTPTSFDSLARFGPSFVLELTATPEQRHQPDHATDPRFASNVLHAVSALELKIQGMIKLPVDLESRNDWLEVLAATKNRREELELIADRAHEDHGIPFYRPIALIQAQPKNRTKETHTPEKVKEAIIRLGVPDKEVKICVGTNDELGDMNLMETNCEVRYVITVDKLREGWDCPLAYVLGSIGNTATATAVEQLIGRILRMPNATPTRVPALDRCYAFVLSDNVATTALQLRDQMVKTCGFDDRSAADALRVVADNSQPRFGFGRIALSEPPRPESVPPTLAAKIIYDSAKHELILTDLPTPGEIRLLRDAVASEADKSAVEQFWEAVGPIGISPKPLDQFARPFRIPRLTVLQGDRRTLFEPIELDEFAWDLNACDPKLTETEFLSDIAVGTAAIIDVEAGASPDDGRLITKLEGEVRLRQLELIGEGEDWSEAELVRWLDSELHRGDSLLGLPLNESQPWLRRVVTALCNDRGLERAMLVRRRHSLAEVLRTKVTDHGRNQTRKATNELFRNNPDAVLTSDEHSILVEEQEYRPTRLLDRGQLFKHHAFDQIGDMNGEELECAQRIDAHPNVARWIRNTEHANHGGYSLPKSPGRFYPDFIVELNDDRLVLVEYKMGKISNDPEELHKKAVGELWAERSNGRCGFAWVVKKDWAELERKLSV